jgi:hypothetical protein
MKKGVALVVFGLALVSGSLGYSKYMQTRREAAYRVALAPFQRDLHRRKSQNRRRKIFSFTCCAYNAIDDGRTYRVEIAQEPPGNLWCEPWRVYVAFEFGSADTLNEVHIRKLETCP